MLPAITAAEPITIPPRPEETFPHLYPVYFECQDWHAGPESRVRVWFHPYNHATKTLHPSDPTASPALKIEVDLWAEAAQFPLVAQAAAAMANALGRRAELELAQRKLATMPLDDPDRAAAEAAMQAARQALGAT